jgi:hypothetical protein
MGMFWDLIQQNELDEQKVKADTLEDVLPNSKMIFSKPKHC